MIEQQYITVAEAARMLGITTATVRNWLKDRRIKHLCIKPMDKGTHLIDYADFKRFIAEYNVDTEEPVVHKRSGGKPRTTISHKEV